MLADAPTYAAKHSDYLTNSSKLIVYYQAEEMLFGSRPDPGAESSD